MLNKSIFKTYYCTCQCFIFIFFNSFLEEAQEALTYASTFIMALHLHVLNKIIL